MDKANDLDTELKLRLMDKADLYRVRLLRLKSAEAEQELSKISQKPAQEEQAVRNCAYVGLECFQLLSAPLHTRSLLCCRRLGKE